MSGHNNPSDRRTFLGLVTVGLSAVFGAVLGAPVLAYLSDPLRRKSEDSTFRPVSLGTSLNALEPNKPVQGVLRAVRRDGWTLHPNDVIGRVWIVPKVAGAALTDGTNPAQLEVFTTICPHLGCSVNIDTAGTGFACPCHNATFTFGGDKAGTQNPAQRGMDTLKWRIDQDPADPAKKVLLVEYKNYKASIKDKEEV